MSPPGSGGAAVTGLGTVGSWGAGGDALLAALAGGEAPLAELGAPGPLAGGDADEASAIALDPRARWAGLVPDGALDGWLVPRDARRMSRPSRFAVAAARMALDAAGVAPATSADDRSLEDVGVILATSYGPSAVTEEMLEQILLSGPSSASPFLFAESVANAPAAQVARLTGARGPNLTVTQREAGALVAVRRAAAEVAAGRSSRAMAGVADEMTPLVAAVFDRFGALARAKQRDGALPPPVARPFDRRRAGFLPAEGSTVLLLEDAAAAAERGAESLALVTGGGEAFDPSAPRTGWGGGHELLGASLRRVLERAGVAPEEVDLVVAGASGSRRGDRMEALVLRAAWGPAGGPFPGETPLPPVVAPKGVTGELGGGHLAAAVLLASGAADGRPLPAPWFRTADPELGVAPHHGPLPRPPRRVLVQTVAAGGAAAWLLLERPPAEGTAEGSP